MQGLHHSTSSCKLCPSKSGTGCWWPILKLSHCVGTRGLATLYILHKYPIVSKLQCPSTLMPVSTADHEQAYCLSHWWQTATGSEHSKTCDADHCHQPFWCPSWSHLPQCPQSSAVATPSIPGNPQLAVSHCNFSTSTISIYLHAILAIFQTSQHQQISSPVLCCSICLWCPPWKI